MLWKVAKPNRRFFLAHLHGVEVNVGFGARSDICILSALGYLMLEMTFVALGNCVTRSYLQLISVNAIIMPSVGV